MTKQKKHFFIDIFSYLVIFRGLYNSKITGMLDGIVKQDKPTVT